MKTDDDYIAGWKTAKDWFALRPRLDNDEPQAWEEAYSDYYKERLTLRYLNPIRILQENGTSQGEGFSIVAIQCSLIEFLESTMQGLTYRPFVKGQNLGQYEYSSRCSVPAFGGLAR